MAIDLPRRVVENVGGFTGRSWLLPKILKWWEGSSERLFLLTGGPGSGKSMAMAWFAGFGPAPLDGIAAKQLTQLRQAVKAGHFCDAASRNINPSSFAESIANQLTNSVAGFAEALAATLADQVKITVTQTINTIAPGGSATGVALSLGAQASEPSFDRAFIGPLKKLYAGGHREPMLLLVDALDEAQTYTGLTIPDLLSRLTDLPTSIRILATTRDEPRVLKFFRNVTTFDLIKDASPDVDDVRTYARHRLRKFAIINDSKYTAFAERLSKQADGVFLYAAMVLDELLKGSIVEFPDLATYPLPKGLSGLYRDFLTRELGKDEQKWFDIFEPLFGLIAVAQGQGLTAQQLTAIIGKDIRAALRAGKQYLSGEIPDGPFRLFHTSFTEFLLEDKNNVDYHIDAHRMHKRIADHYWSQNHSDWTQADEYAIAYMPTHVGTLQAWHEVEELLLNARFVRRLSNLSNKALADAYHWALPCLKHMEAGPRRALLSELCGTVVQKLRLFTGRTAEMRVIESFLESQDRQHLLVIGPPGIGKTLLMSFVWVRHFDQCFFMSVNPLHHFESLPRSLADVMRDSPFYQGCELPEEFVRTPRSVLLYQLFDIVWRNKKNACFIVDGVDALRNVELELAEFPINLPPGIRMIWASRSMAGLTRLIPNASVLDMSEMNPPEILDLCRRSLGKEAREDLVERIADLSQGNPLYIALIANEIERGLPGEAIERLEHVTSAQSLPELYEASLQQLEAAHPGIAARIASLVDLSTDQGKTSRVRLKDLQVQFGPDELDAMERAGLVSLEHTSEGTFIGAIHTSLLDFLRQRHAAGRVRESQT